MTVSKNQLTVCPCWGYVSITDRRSLIAFDFDVPDGGVHMVKTQFWAFGLQLSKAKATVGDPMSVPATKVWKAWRRLTDGEYAAVQATVAITTNTRIMIIVGRVSSENVEKWESTQKHPLACCRVTHDNFTVLRSVERCYQVVLLLYSSSTWRK